MKDASACTRAGVRTIARPQLGS